MNHQPKKKLSFVGVVITFFFLATSVVRAEDEEGGLTSWLFGSSSHKSAPAPRTEVEQQGIDVYKKVNRAVVNISTRTEVFDIYGASQQEGSGSGVVINAKKGWVITNHHVIEGATQIALTLANGQSYPVKLVGRDPDNDIALLELIDPPSDLVDAEFGDSSTLEVGQRVFAIGNPFGLNRTMTQGIVSSLGRSIRAESGRLIEDIIQTDAAVNPGNSGGPLLDSAGRIVGLNTAIVSQSGGSNGIGFSVPVNQIKNAIPQLVKYGKVLRANLGAKFLDTEVGPALLTVDPDGPADEAGLQGARQVFRRGFFVGELLDVSRADFILTVNGKEVQTKTDVLDVISKLKEGEKVVLGVRRGLDQGAIRTVKVKPRFN